MTEMRTGEKSGKQVAIVVVAYNAVTTLERTLERIPSEVWELVSEVCVFDDASSDHTYEAGLDFRRREGLDKLRVYRNRTNQGYGGNQKLAYRYAISKGYDIAVLLHGDGQYAPEVMMRLLEPLLEERADAVMGSRMMVSGEALHGGMPLYKWVGNRILSGFENLVLHEDLTEYHSGYRAYNLDGLAELPLERNTDDFHFDTQIIVQLMAAGKKIVEVPIPTYYGDEICYVDGLHYAANVARSVLRYKLHSLGLRSAPEYDVASAQQTYPARARPYQVHDRIARRVPSGSKVLEVGCGEGHLSRLLASKGCVVDGVDKAVGDKAREACRSVVEADLDEEVDAVFDELDDEYDYVVAGDVLEHLRFPQTVLEEVGDVLAPRGRLIASTGNVAHWFIRLQLLTGNFQYTPRGILDATHLRLYTRESFQRLLEDSGFEVSDGDVTVLPLEELHPMLESGKAVRLFQKIYYEAARRWPGLIAYQIILEARAAPDPLEDVFAQSGK
jgi:2-polyprenyl-3-methyl-5-hydroxy-6-metoxy-1,4-benzoquinol methylase